MVADAQPGLADTGVGQLRGPDGDAFDVDVTRVDQQPVFVVRIDVEGQRGTGIEAQLRTDQGGEGGHRGGLTEQGAEEDQGLPTVEVDRLRCVVVEAAGAVAVGVGQDGPQLHAVEDGGVGGGDLGVADPGAGRHQVDLAGDDCGVVIAGIVVFDIALEQPGDGLQARVGVRGHVHAAGDGDVVGAVVVHEAPGADETALALGEGAVDRHGSGSAQGYFPGGDDLDLRAIGAVGGGGGEDLFFGVLICDGHDATLPAKMMTCQQSYRGCGD